MSTTMTTAQLLEKLRTHYVPDTSNPGGIFLPEVSFNGIWGGEHSVSTNRRCDAIWAGFTSVSGRKLVGHELKVSRADWLKELRHQGKADPWADNCHQWWLVVPEPSIVKDGELPEGWGLMCPYQGASTRRKRFVIIAPAPVRNITPSWDVVRSVMARATTLETTQRLRLVTQEVAAQLERRDAARAKIAPAPLTPQQRGLLRAVEQFTALTGITIAEYGDRIRCCTHTMEANTTITPGELYALVSSELTSAAVSQRMSRAQDSLEDALRLCAEVVDFARNAQIKDMIDHE